MNSLLDTIAAAHNSFLVKRVSSLRTIVLSPLPFSGFHLAVFPDSGLVVFITTRKVDLVMVPGAHDAASAIQFLDLSNAQRTTGMEANAINRMEHAL